MSSTWFRRAEIALWVLGMCLLGAASGATVVRWNYQRQQERALFSRGPAVSVTSSGDRAAPSQQLITTMVGAPAVSTGYVDRHERPDDRSKPAETIKQAIAVHRPTHADPSALGRIEVPRLGIAAIVSEGSDEGTLDRAVGLLPGSARPGEAGNMVLAAHRDTFFWPLQDVRLNDRIRFVEPGHTYEYRVQSLRVVSADETSVLASNGVEELTLVTCYPFSYVGPAPDRFIVKAARVN